MIKLTAKLIQLTNKSLIWYISLYWSKISAAASSISPQRSNDLREVSFQSKDAVHLVHDQDLSSL